MVQLCIFCFYDPSRICLLCKKDRKKVYNRTYYFKTSNIKRFPIYKKCSKCKIEKLFEEYNGVRLHRTCIKCRKTKISEISKKYYYKRRESQRSITRSFSEFNPSEKIILYI